MEKPNIFKKYKSLITFFILDFIALLSFNFADKSEVFSVAGAVLALIATIFLLGVTKNKKDLLILLPPVLLLFFISGIASFNKFSSIYSAQNYQNIALFLALPAFFIIGFSLRKFNDIKPLSLLLIIGAALAAATFFGLLSTLINYGFFYTTRFKQTPFYYYNGGVYDVTKEMTWLNGFKFSEVTLSYGSAFAILCAAYLPGLLFISPKKDRNSFIEILLIGSIGFVTLALIGNWKTIIILLVVSLCVFIYKLTSENKKALKIMEISAYSVVFLGILFFVVALVNVKIGYKLPGILNRVFASNVIMNKCTPIMEEVIGGGPNAWFGIEIFESEKLFLDSGVFEVELLKEVGIIGTFAFLLLLLSMIYFVFRFLRKSKDSGAMKGITLSFMLSFFIYQTLENTIKPYPLEEKTIKLFLRSPLTWIVIIVFGFIYFAEPREEEK